MKIQVPKPLQCFLTTDKRYNLAYGGRYGTKSWFFGALLLSLGMREKTTLLFAREVQESLADSVFALSRADAICYLPGAEKSTGAMIEKSVAEKDGKEVIEIRIEEI